MVVQNDDVVSAVAVSAAPVNVREGTAQMTTSAEETNQSSILLSLHYTALILL